MLLLSDNLLPNVRLTHVLGLLLPLQLMVQPAFKLSLFSIAKLEMLSLPIDHQGLDFTTVITPTHPPYEISGPRPEVVDMGSVLVLQ